MVTLPLAAQGEALHLVLCRKEVRYYLEHGASCEPWITRMSVSTVACILPWRT